MALTTVLDLSTTKAEQAVGHPTTLPALLQSGWEISIPLRTTASWTDT